ncbi:MAG: hypothetical protein HY263_05780 [Chloroflexi bacterium]|nr:hypothetical protein [Chloroflexota bacterium]
MDDPSVVVTEPLPVARRTPETLRQALRGTRHALFGIELTLVAAVVLLMFGPSGLAGLLAFIIGAAGLVFVLEGMEG